jgi:hypothetical protein
MTTAEMHDSNPYQGVMLLLVAILILTLAAAAVAVLNHANLRHGNEAQLARGCTDQPLGMFFNPATGRTALVCLTEEGKFGIVVLNELGEEITAFVKNKMKLFSQVEQYLKNAGYGLIQ